MDSMLGNVKEERKPNKADLVIMVNEHCCKSSRKKKKTTPKWLEGRKKKKQSPTSKSDSENQRNINIVDDGAQDVENTGESFKTSRQEQRKTDIWKGGRQ